MTSIKIENLNPSLDHAVQVKQAAVKVPSAMPDDASIVSRVDSINLSIPNIQSGNNLSTLLSNLIDIFQKMSPDDSSAFRVPHSAFLDSLFYKGDEPLSFLKDFINKSGLLYEAKIAKGDIKAVQEDLKGLLLRLIEKSGPRSEGGKAALELLNGIEARQLLNVKAKDDGALYLQIPMIFFNGPSTAEIYVKRDGNGRSRYEQDVYNVGFSIEMRGAGVVSMYAVVSGNNVSIRIQAEKPDFLEFVRSHIPDLAERFDGYGIKTLVMP